jgi:two-component system invasion response regulator UvrY
MFVSVITKVLLADDHELVRTGFEVLLNSFDDILVVAVCGSGEEAVELVQDYAPDVVLMDIGMPGIGGVEACRRILKKHPDIKIIIVSIYNNGPLPQQLLKLGVKGFVSKGAKVDEMVEAIRQVMAGKRFLSADIAENLAFQGLEDDESPFSRLSQRESEVAELILQGKSIQEMAEILELSDKTINTYRYRLYEKLKVKNDVELTRLAVKYQCLGNIDH